MRTIVAIQGDKHAGHKLGLLNPTVSLPDEGPDGAITYHKPAPTAIQRWLWGHYTDDVKAVADLANGDRIIVLDGGDMTSGKKYPDGLISTRDFDQVLLAAGNMLPWMMLSNVDTVRFVHGTEAHEMGEGSTPHYIAKLLSGQFPDRDIATAAHYALSVNGVLIDVAHHGSGPGIRTWTRGNQVRYYTRSLMDEALLEGDEMPRVVVRHHFHSLIHETVRLGPHVCDSIICPSFAGLTYHARQSTRSVYRLGCGTVALEIVDGTLADVHVFHHKTDLRTKEVL